MSSACAMARLYALMHPDGRDGLNAFQRVLVAMILASVTAAVLFSEPAIRDVAGRELAWLEFGFGALFMLEYLARVWSAGSQPRFAGVLGRLRYMRQPMAVVDLLAVLPFLAGLFGAETMVLRMVRLLRLLALSKLARYSNAIRLVA